LTGWVASLSAGEISNWDICREKNLFGSGAPRASGVRAGDTIYFWWATRGLFARALATSDAQPVTHTNRHQVPWPSPERYKYLIPIEVLNDLGTSTLELRWQELNDLAGMGGIPASQFPPVDVSHVPRLDALFVETSSLIHGATSPLELDVPIEQDERDAILQAVMRRQGQPTFRNKLLSEYRHCLVTGSSVTPVLEAAHIAPYRGAHTNIPENGLLLRSDVHNLFDLSLLTVTPDLTIRVAPELRQTVYGGFHEDELTFPIETDLRPHGGLLKRHNDTCTWL
jgi:putative restriction endonuclease